MDVQMSPMQGDTTPTCGSEETEKMNSDTPLARWRSCRYLLAYWCFLGSFCIFAMRRNISLTIVCMVNRTETVSNISELTAEGEFAWTREEQSFLLGSFFYGYSLGGVPGGWLADRHGARAVLIASVLVSGVSTVLVTLAHNYFLMLALRILSGLVCGAYIPALAALFAKWSPTYELVRLLSIAQSGAFVGAASSLAISGILCETFGWRSVFYVTGTISIIWSVISLFLIGSNPQQCRFIRRRELKHIQFHSTTTKRRIPWRTVSTSLPIYAIIVGFCLAVWYNTVEATGLNLYVDDILLIGIINNGIQTAIPQVVLFISMMVSVFLADKVIRRFQAFYVRKTAQAIGGLCQMVSLLTMAFLDHNDWVLAILMFNLGRVGYGICIGAGYKANLMDTAPQLAGTLTGVGNSIGLLISFLCPVLIGFLTANRDRFGWQLVFYISSGVILAGNVFFLVFAGSKPLVFRRSGGTDQEGHDGSDDGTDRIGKI